MISMHNKISLILFFGVMVPTVSCETSKAITNGDMVESIETMAWSSDYQSGQWEPDWDDAAFYGPAFYGRVGWEENRADYQERAEEALQRNLTITQEALAGPADQFLEGMTEILYGMLGAMDVMVASGDMTPLDTVDAALDQANLMSQVLANDYLDGFSNYAMDTYGPTVVTAMVAIVNLQYAVLLDTPRESDRVEKARTMLRRIEEEAWNGTYYQFAPDRPDELFLYPNIVMIIALARMYQATAEEPYLQRAEAVYDAIQPLRCPDRPGYRSPYSAAVMGATTDDYTTLSAMNYTIFAFALLSQITEKQVYRDEIDSILDFIREYLFVPEDGRVYHHWMDGRLAVPTDPEYYCIGCNLQLLYVIWWIRHHLGAGIK